MFVRDLKEYIQGISDNTEVRIKLKDSIKFAYPERVVYEKAHFNHPNGEVSSKYELVITIYSLPQVVKLIE